jgi:hypothetical protein
MMPKVLNNTSTRPIIYVYNSVDNLIVTVRN